MRLILVRHATAVAGEGLPDHDRPLAEQGQREARAIGAWLRDHVDVPDVVWCSSALRVRQTWTIAADQLTDPPEPSYLRSVYLAGPGDLLDLVRDLPPTVESALVVGHNPTLQQALAALTGEPPRRFPTGALAVLEVDGGWSSAGPARLVTFAVLQEEGT